MRARRSSRARRAGFTLIELMVAMTIGAIVIATVYTLGGASARNFQEQQRVSQLQLSTRLALDRVRRDIERAGLHGTPNSALERTCGAASRPVQAIFVDHNADESRAALNTYEAAASNPTTQGDLLRLVGNFVTADAYLVRGLNGTGDVAHLQTQWQGFRRTFVVPSADPTVEVFDDQLFATVFAPGRMLHIQDTRGTHFFVTVTSAVLTGTEARIEFTPNVPASCMAGLGEGSLLAPLGEVQYHLSATPADAVPLQDEAVTGPNVALVRRELNMATGAVRNERTVLEWAVHFDVDAVLDQTPLGFAPDSRLFTLFDDDDTQIQLLPHRVRSLIVSLGARTPEQDPSFGWVIPTAADPLARFKVFTIRPGAARVRTATAEINLPNLANRGM